MEIEHLPVHNSDDTAVTYYEPNGIETLLKRLVPYYDEDKEYWENGHLVGLARPGVAVSLEPGGQVETSIGILKKPSDLNTLYSSSVASSPRFLTISTSDWSTTVTSPNPALRMCRSTPRIATMQ